MYSMEKEVSAVKIRLVGPAVLENWDSWQLCFRMGVKHAEISRLGMNLTHFAKKNTPTLALYNTNFVQY